MNLIKESIENLREYKELAKTVAEQIKAPNPHPCHLHGMCDGARNALISTLGDDFKGSSPILVIVKDEREASALATCFNEFGIKSVFYPERDFVMYNISSSHEDEQKRIGALTAVLMGECDVLITTPDAALQYTIPKEKLSDLITDISSSDSVDLDWLCGILTACGYVRTEMVDAEGQFSVRGGILDLFSPGSPFPVRIELFGDDIDSMSYFDILTQRRNDSVDSVRITPAREVIPTEEIKTKIAAELKKLISACDNERTKDSLSNEYSSTVSGGEMLFRDRYISFIYPEKECLLDYLEKDTVTVLCDFSACKERAEGAEWHSNETASSVSKDGLINVKYAEYSRESGYITSFISSHPGIIADHFMTSVGDIKLSGLFGISTKPTTSYKDNDSLLIEDLEAYSRGGYISVIMCENDVVARYYHDTVKASNIPCMYSNEVKAYEKGFVIISVTPFPGFELSDGKIAFLSTASADGKANEAKKDRALKKSKRARERIMSYADLTEGDYVVHIKYGIGQYIGMESVTVEGITSDYVKIKYDGSGSVFLPCNQLDSISKYIGPKNEDGAVKLAKIGGNEWGRAKAKVKEAARNMAKELLSLYAERERLPGYAFLKDDDMQKEFESTFPYEETDGQLVAIDEVKRDMERNRPMDRLLCGDVGFGKTEVALRAAFKAVVSGKQVAVLVPTTILAMQHYQTFVSRMRGFPVHVEMLSRFRTPKQIEESLRRIKRGEADIVVGTHRILSDDVKFRDLGLVIVDEEQRFGVGAKEKLRKLTACVDTLTLTATPIPRTLSMAMSGIRDMSVLEEAPGDRVPVHTYVLEYDEIILGEAVRRELRRGGQVFWLRNRVDALEETAERLRKIVPDARIAVASGRTERDEISDTWQSMLNGEIDVLVCTTIIESGVDVPNANTLIIEDADCFGLSQLHQIRGRVGRSSRHAYAYFTYRKNKVLSDISVKRLEAIKEYTEFGSGFKVALRDLEIRGAGNILGAEQSGHIENVGYDLYMKLLNEAVLEARGETPAIKTECTVDFGVSAYIPDKYIASSRQRIDVYKKISLITCVDDTVDIIDEIIDRYGEMPSPVVTLLDLALLRTISEKCGIEKVQKRGNCVIIVPEKMDVKEWITLTEKHRGQILVTLDSKPYATFRPSKGGDIIEDTLELIKELAEIQERKNA